MKAIYRSDGWVLGRCTKCPRTNYVEPHGTTAQCKCSPEWTEHTNIPQSERIEMLKGPYLRRQPKLSSPHTSGA